MTTDVETAWTELSSRLRKLIRSRVADDATADDLVQDVFLKISRRGDDWEYSRNLEAWLFRVARNAVIDHYRTRKELRKMLEDCCRFEFDWCGRVIDCLPHTKDGCAECG